MTLLWGFVAFGQIHLRHIDGYLPLKVFAVWYLLAGILKYKKTRTSCSHPHQGETLTFGYQSDPQNL